MPVLKKEEAIKKLMENDVVALPTETVYGLAAMVSSDEALNKIFSTKSRPFFDPLIIHVKNLKQAQDFAHFDETSLKLAQTFWPGPLTLVLPKKENVSDLISSGGATVAVRCPNHPVFLEVLEALTAPLAAPSANMFGRTSPTTAEHVIKEFADQVNVVDGSPCEKGIESTVVQLSLADQKLFILRSGVITESQLNDFFKTNNPDISVERKKQTNAPGHLKNHYQPTSTLFLVTGTADQTLSSEAFKLLEKTAGSSVEQWRLPNSASLAARKLYSDLRDFSQSNQACYLIVPPAWEENDEWHGLLDRLTKAAHFSLNKSDGQWDLSQKD